MPLTEFPILTKTLASAASEMLLGLGLENVDNTSDASKPISTLTQTALNLKADATALTAGLATKAASSHTHAQSEVTELEAALTLRVKSDIAQAGDGVGGAVCIPIANFVGVSESDYVILENNSAVDPDTTYILLENP